MKTQTSDLHKTYKINKKKIFLLFITFVATLMAYQIEKEEIKKIKTPIENLSDSAGY